MQLPRHYKVGMRKSHAVIRAKHLLRKLARVEQMEATMHTLKKKKKKGT